MGTKVSLKYCLIATLLLIISYYTALQTFKNRSAEHNFKLAQ